MVAPIKMPIIIGIAGNRYQAGKSTVLERFRKHGQVYKLAYADALKGICLDLGWNGEKDKKGRRLLQLMGTEVCRECIDSEYWVRRWNLAFSKFVKNYEADFVICDDLRFPNEYINLKKMNAYLIYVYRPDKISLIQRIIRFFSRGHKSEGQIKQEDCNFYISNSGSFEDFVKQIELIIELIKGKENVG